MSAARMTTTVFVVEGTCRSGEFIMTISIEFIMIISIHFIVINPIEFIMIVSGLRVEGSGSRAPGSSIRRSR